MFKDSTKARDLTIHIDTGATVGTKAIPVIYGHPEALTPLQATVSLETSHDVKAKGVEITFKAVAGSEYYAPEEVTLKLEGEQVFYSKQWDLDVQFSKPGWIAKGSYSRIVSALLDPTIPSSTYHYSGWMKYEFEARLKEAKGFSITRTDIVATQEVWVLNSSIPALGLSEPPEVVETTWRAALPLSVSIPSKTLCLEQLVPIVVQLKPFLPGSKYEGQEAIVTNVSFVLQETRTSRALYTKYAHQITERVLNLSINTGWPQSTDGWERTIYVSLPPSPVLSCGMMTRYLDVTHNLAVTMDFRVSSRMERIQTTMDVEITSPRPISAAPPGPPGYDSAAQVVDAVLGVPPELLDDLPRYARYE